MGKRENMGEKGHEGEARRSKWAEFGRKGERLVG